MWEKSAKSRLKQAKQLAENCAPVTSAGQSGLEREYNDLLVGTDGMRRVIVNSVGKEMGHLDQQEAIPGKQIQLTIDYDLQQMAEAGLGDKRGAVVALDPRTGEVLAFASHPAPDPNDFAVRISKEEWQRLNEDPGKPLLNRVTQAQLAPGSVFKIIMATAMLESQGAAAEFHGILPGLRGFLRADAQMLGVREEEPRLDRFTRSDCAIVRRVFLQRGHAHGHWDHCEIRQDAGAGSEDRELTCLRRSRD